MESSIISVPCPYCGQTVSVAIIRGKTVKVVGKCRHCSHDFVVDYSWNNYGEPSVLKIVSSERTE